ncbi:suppressor of fused domain protein [Hahella aquimaris]|uniref:suppressor of fused domain protein n=1 Tax=Hahella sp. HNIBRBA332 TaxID=3015983 RepID=UPI00273BA35C|nr:suppressor of fused domain protein [Hahella sp. HNIBRBA332]WLQ14317.1 suppressor of fused domain protein [Hahella sp. HNIBRBA332]
MMAILDYYHSKYGEASRTAKFISPDGLEVYVLKWDESQIKEGVTMYVTLGASNLLGDSNEGCEFFIGLTPEVDSIANALAEIAIHGNGTKGIPSSGDTTTLAYKLWEGTSARTFMFTDGDEVIPSVKNELGKDIRFIQLVPLFDSELKYKKMHGEGALWERLEKMEMPYWDSIREDTFL